MFGPGASESRSSDERAAVRHAQADAQLGTRAVVYLGNVVTAIVIAAVLWRQVSQAVLACWVFAVAVVYLPVFRNWMRRWREIESGYRPGQWDFRMAVLGGVAGTPWIIPPLMVEAGAWPALETMFACIAIGLSSITVAANSSNAALSRVYTGVLTIAFVLRNLLSGDTVLIAVGALTVPYLAYLWSFQETAHRRLIRSIRNELHNERLATALADANGRLEEKVSELAHSKAIAETARRDAEQAKNAAEAATRAKSQFLANMSHELRTPLNAIIGFSEILKVGLYGPLGHPRYSEYAGDVHQSGQHLLSIINDILDMAKIEAGRTELREAETPVTEITAAALRIVSEQARLAGLTLVNDLERCDLRLLADARAVKQMLLNLLANAIKFTRPGGSIRVGGRVEPDGALRLLVTDTGIGIAPDDLQRVLKPFSEVDNALTRAHAGTGLGLSLVKALIEMHGGTLVLDSELNVGTTASLRFPGHRVRDRSDVKVPA